MKIHPDLVHVDQWVGEQDLVRQAASHSVRARLKTLQQNFTCACISKKESVEPVHQLRVATRRLLAAIDLYGELLPNKPTKKLRQTLQRIQRTGGALRDLDVIAKRYCKDESKNAKQLIKALIRRRSRVQIKLEELFHRLCDGERLLKQSKKMLAELGSSKKGAELARTWMKLRWSQVLQQFYQFTDVDTADFDSLHRFRILTKQLRYSFELLSPAFDPTKREIAYRFLEQLQNRLGQIQDHVSACKLFDKWESKGNRISRACKLHRLIEVENEMLQQSQSDFIAWWTPHRKAEISQAFDQLAN